jgi:RecB family endonuclease NucS
MAERTFGDASIPPHERAAMELARHLKRQNLSAFNARDVGRAVGGVLRTSDVMSEACRTLEEAGLIRRKVKSKSRPGRTPNNYEVNPRLHQGGAE